MRLRAFRRQEDYDWGEVSGGQEDQEDPGDSGIIDLTGPDSHGRSRLAEVTPPRRVEAGPLGQRKLVRTDVDENQGQPFTPPGYDASKNYGGKDPDLQR